MTDESLLKRFVATFGAFDDLSANRAFVGRGNIEPLLLGQWDEWGFADWKPIAERTPREALQEVYRVVHGRFPPLYEDLVLSYRWYRVDVGPVQLLSSLPPNLDGLVEAITNDNKLFTTLSRGGFVQFGKGSDVDYDPVCFDSSNLRDGDCRIVKFDHEEILMNDRLVEVAELAPTFRQLVEQLVREGEDELRRRPNETDSESE